MALTIRRTPKHLPAWLLLGAALTWGQSASCETTTADPERSKFRSDDDGWFDLSNFLEEKHGFLPLLVPITEPAVGFGAAGGLAFLGRPIGKGQGEFERPDITVVGGLGTANGTWGAGAGDWRHWLGGRLQTMIGAVYASANLDFYGIGADALLANHPLRYNLEPTGGVVQAKYRLGESQLWAGMSYSFATTRVSFDAPAAAPGLPGFSEKSDVGGLTPSLTFDTRDNVFTPLRGSYIEGIVGVFDESLGSDEAFQRARVIGMQFFPLKGEWFVGYRGEIAASFGDAPFYLRPFVGLRGAPILRYQGEEIAQLEAEVRWQCWKRFSVVGFAGYGAAWNNFERLDDTQTLATGGAGFRYEIARRYGIHMGIDVAVGPDNTAMYVQVGSAWSRP